MSLQNPRQYDTKRRRPAMYSVRCFHVILQEMEKETLKPVMQSAVSKIPLDRILSRRFQRPDARRPRDRAELAPALRHGGC